MENVILGELRPFPTRNCFPNPFGIELYVAGPGARFFAFDLLIASRKLSVTRSNHFLSIFTAPEAGY